MNQESYSHQFPVVLLHSPHSSSEKSHSMHWSIAKEFMKGILCNHTTKNEIVTRMNQIAELSETGSLNFDVS